MNQPTQKFYAMEKSDDGTATIHLYDEIGGWGQGSKEFLTDLAQLKGQHIHLRINSPGGSVIEGTAIYNALRRHEGGLTVHIDALCASMASVIAMAGVPTYMADNALLMIHNPWTISAGDADQLRKEADLLDKMKAALVNAYKRKSGMEEEEIEEMMDKETWMNALEAVALGFVDGIEEGVAAAATATPAQLRARFDKFASGMDKKASVETPAAPAAELETPAPIEPPAAPVETPAEPAAPSDSTEAPAADPVVEEPAAPAEPQAKVNAADAILAKYNEVLARAEAAEVHAKAVEARLEIVKGELAAKAEDLDRLERSLGLAAARTVPNIEQAATPADIYTQWKNASGAEKTRIFRTHRKDLEAHAKMHGV